MLMDFSIFFTAQCAKKASLSEIEIEISKDIYFDGFSWKELGDNEEEIKTNFIISSVRNMYSTKETSYSSQTSG